MADDEQWYLDFTSPKYVQISKMQSNGTLRRMGIIEPICDQSSVENDSNRSIVQNVRETEASEYSSEFDQS